MKEEFILFNTTTAVGLTKEISQLTGIRLGKLHTQKFSDGEVFVRYEESIREKTVFIVAQANMPYENLFELFLAIDAARRASAKEVICIVPYLPHSRQERKDRDRASISARLIADFIQQAGANRLITVDLHSSSVEGFFKIPVDHLECNRIFADHIRSLKLENLCLCSPDFGGLKRIKKYKQLFDCDIAVMHKERLKPNQVNHMEIIGDVKNKSVVIIDDMVDTAGTLCKAAEVLKESGALSVIAYATHGILSGNAIERIENAALQKLYTSDSIQQYDLNKIESISCAPVLARALDKLIHHRQANKTAKIKPVD